VIFVDNRAFAGSVDPIACQDPTRAFHSKEDLVLEDLEIETGKDRAVEVCLLQAKTSKISKVLYRANVYRRWWRIPIQGESEGRSRYFSVYNLKFL
jgi:hypothetical protein